MSIAKNDDGFSERSIVNKSIPKANKIGLMRFGYKGLSCYFGILKLKNPNYDETTDFCLDSFVRAGWKWLCTKEEIQVPRQETG
jgi:hypothetical protein